MNSFTKSISIIDAHCHIWNIKNGYYGWLSNKSTPLLGNIEPLDHDYLPQNLLHDTKPYQLKKFVHIEASSSTFEKQEVEWLVKVSETCPELGSVVGGIELRDKQLPGRLDYYSSTGLVKGIRQILNWNPNPKYAAVDSDNYLLNPQWQQGFALLAKHDLSFDMQICPNQMLEVCELAKKFSNTLIIIEHAGFPIDSMRAMWKKGIKALSELDNVVIKISGFGMFNHHWTTESIRDDVLYVIECFGFQRSMFGSNFPVDRLYCDFSKIMDSYAEIFSGCSEDEMRLFFYETAAKTYKVD